MEKAKRAVSNFLSKDGKHDTTIDEDVREAVVKEHIHPQQHEAVVAAIDKETHQDHHQTVLQPIISKETLPEKHTHNALAVEHKTFQHGKEGDVEAALKQEAAKYKDESITHDTEYTTAAAPVLSGERTHHHVHHHIQPVIQKEVIQPEVVHTTAPVHETHHAAAIHHETTVLPAKTMEEFKSTRGDLKAQTPKKLSEFEGCPNLMDKRLQDDERARQAIHGNLQEDAKQEIQGGVQESDRAKQAIHGN